MTTKQAQKVVVVGGGYGGAIAALRLAGRAGRRAEVTLVDPKPHFVQRLRLHQVATGQPMAEPTYEELLGRRAAFTQGWVEEIDGDRGVVRLAGADRRTLPFDRLILATGSTVDLAGVPGVAEHAHDVADAPAARRLDQALHHSPAGWVVAVVGAGMTGIEMATEIAGAYPHLNVRLVSRGVVGGWLSPRGRGYLHGSLRRQGIERVEGAEVRAVEDGRLALADGSDVPFGLLVWCGGFRPSGLAAASGLALDGLGRAAVDRSMRSLSHPQIVVAGDVAGSPSFVAGSQLRMCCQVTVPEAAQAADTVLAELKGREPKEFHFGYYHQPISLGRRDALIQFTDRGDRPRDRILTGRKAAFYKESINSSTLPAIKLLRFAPRATWWPFHEPRAESAPMLKTEVDAGR
jgi:NADH:quinone reductase (non-electrogenic)